MAFSRRDFLKRTCCTAAAGFAAASFNRFGLVNALAQSSQDYKALVCVFLFGGNDSNNMIVPLSSADTLPTSRSARCWPCRRPVCCPSLRPARVSFGLPSQTPRDAVPVQSEASGGAGQRGHAGSPHHPRLNIQQTPSPAPPKSLLARRPAGADADRNARLTATVTTGWAGRTADKIQSILRRELPHHHFAGRDQYFLRGLVCPRDSVQRRPHQIALGLQQFG